MMSITRNMRSNNFIILQIADFISSFGSAMTSLALTVTIYSMTGSLGTTALFGVVSLLPQFLISPFISLVSIRTSFKRLFFLGEFICIIPLLLLLATNSVMLIYIVYFLYCSIFFFLECYRAEFLKSISNDENIQSRQGVSRFVNGLVMIVAPIVGGTIVEFFGIKCVFILDIITYIIAAVIILALKGNEKPALISRNSYKGFISSLSSNTEIYIGGSLTTFIGGAISILTIEYTYKIMSGTSLQYSILMGALAVGGLIGNLLGSRARNLKRASFIAMFMLGLLLFSVTLKPGFISMVFILISSGILSSVLMLYYATALFIKSSNEEIRDRYLVFQNLIDASNAGSKPMGALLNSAIGCVKAIAVLGGVFVIAGVGALASLWKK